MADTHPRLCTVKFSRTLAGERELGMEVRRLMGKRWSFSVAYFEREISLSFADEDYLTDPEVDSLA